MDDLKNLKFVVKCAKRAALRDGYNQLIMLDEVDNTYYFTRSYGQQTTDKVIGKVVFYWDDGIAKTKSYVCLHYSKGRYGLYEELNTCYHKVLDSSGSNDMTNKEMCFYLDSIIAGLTYTKKENYGKRI